MCSEKPNDPRGKPVIVAEGIRGGERLVVNPGDELATGVLVEVRPESGASTNVAQRTDN